MEETSLVVGDEIYLEEIGRSVIIVAIDEEDEIETYRVAFWISRKEAHTTETVDHIA